MFFQSVVKVIFFRQTMSHSPPILSPPILSPLPHHRFKLFYLIKFKMFTSLYYFCPVLPGKGKFPSMTWNKQLKNGKK